MTDKKSKLELLLEQQHITESEAIAVIKSSRQKLSQTAIIKIPKQHIRYMYMSDTHIGHNKFSEATFDHMIKYSKKFKPDFIVHPGDHLEGMSHRPGHVYELNEIGFSNQINKAVDLYSQFNGIPIYGIDGNHDQWYFAPQNAGVCVGDELEMRIKGYKNLGQDEGRIEFAPGKQIMLFHGNDGTAYAESYKLQKLVESLPLDDKSVIIHSGHYHKSLYTYIRDKHCFESGTLCEQSKFMRGKKLPARVGFGIVDVWYNKKSKDNRVEINHKWVPAGVYNEK